MRELLLAILVLVAVRTPALADVQLGPIHQVENLARVHTGDSYFETTDAEGNRTVVYAYRGAGVMLGHERSDGTLIAPPVYLVSHYEVETAALRFDDGVLYVSWYDGAGTVSIGAFDLTGHELDRSVHAVDTSFCCLGYTSVSPGVDGSWYLLQQVEQESATELRTIRYDRDGADPHRTILIARDEERVERFIHPAVAVAPDGTVAWMMSRGRNAVARFWDEAGNALSGEVLLGEMAATDTQFWFHAFALGDGRFVLAWRSGDTPSQWVAREVAVDAAATTTTTTVTTTTTMPDVSAWPDMSYATKILDVPRHIPSTPFAGRWRQPDPLLATDGQQTWVASWTDWIGSDLGVFVAVSNNSGRTWGGAQYLGEGRKLVVASDEDGRWLAAAADCAPERFSGCVWRFWRSTDGARTWIRIEDPSAVHRSSWDDLWYGYEGYIPPSRLLSRGDGAWILVADGRLATSGDDGGTWRWYDRDDLSDSALVALSSSEMVLLKRHTLYGLATDAPDSGVRNQLVQLTPHWSEPFAPYRPMGFSAASDADQTIVAAWSSRSDAPDGWEWDPDVIFSRSEDGGTTWTQPYPINGYAFGDAAVDDRPFIATDRRGKWLAAWRSTYLSDYEPTSGGDVLASCSGDDGRTWSVPAILAPAQVASAERYRLQALVGGEHEEGRWAALWTTGPAAGTNGGAGDYELWMQMTPPEGTCGDGEVGRDEACDDGNTVDGDGCDSNCTPTGCGNAVTTTGEECDDGNLSSVDACSSSCTLSWCGDGIVRWDTEHCDDGNDDPTDDCTTRCRQPVCGDGFVYAGHEECDDGNSISADGCDANCRITRCGNGYETEGESCDDGNTSNEDWCLNDCSYASCGDGYLWAGSEECDDGNSIEEDGCSTYCWLPRCGDRILSVGVEECDDGNNDDRDDCDGNCTLPRCGNGRLGDGEVCDDGNTAEGDRCSFDCLRLRDDCGDADSSGAVSARDAQRVLRTAIGLAGDCPRWACDVNGSGDVTALDAGIVLHEAVGLQVELNCRSVLRIRMASASLLGTLDIEIEHSETSGSFRNASGRVSCVPLVPVYSGFGDSGRALLMAFWDLDEGFKGPVDLAECVFRRFATPTDDDFAVHVIAVDPTFEDLDVPVQIEVIVE